MEWNTSNVIQYIIKPYFKRVDRRFNMLDPFQVKGALGKQPRDRLQKLLAQAREKGIKGEYPFLTLAYMETVVTNFWDTVDIEEFSVDRQEGINRNVTEFSKDLLGNGLAVFKGGGWHAVKHRLEGETFYRDAAYLNEVFAPTKGKVATIQINALGFSFAEIAGLDLPKRMSSATNYNDFVRDFQEALAGGRAVKDAHYLLERGGLNIFDRLVAKTGYRMGRDILRIESVDWDRLSAIHGKTVLENRARDYDAIVYVLRSGLEVMRPRVLEK